MTTLYLPTPGLFVDKPFCQNLLVKEREAPRAGGTLDLDLVSVGIQETPRSNQPPNGQEAPLGMGI